MLLTLRNYFASPPMASVFVRALSYTGETCEAETLTLCRNVPSPFRQVLASWCLAEPQVPGLSPAVPELPTCGPFHRCCVAPGVGLTPQRRKYPACQRGETKRQRLGVEVQEQQSPQRLSFCEESGLSFMKRALWSACSSAPTQGQKEQDWALLVQEEALEKQLASGGRTRLDFPPGPAYLAAQGAGCLAPYQAVALGAGRAGSLPQGCCRSGTAFSGLAHCCRGAFVS